MARVLAFVPDLLFGSNVQGALQAAGHEVELVSALSPSVPGSAERISAADVLVVDLTADPAARIEMVRDSGSTPRLAFYSHVESDVRAAALEAGFELVVPRSRMAREAGALVDRLAGSR